MATHLTTTNLSRRAALTGAMAALSTVPAIAAAAVPGVHPDAELLQMCSQWRAFNDQYQAALGRASDLEDACMKAGDMTPFQEAEDFAYTFYDDLCSVTDRITDISARSLAGIRAKAELIVAFKDKQFYSDVAQVLGESIIDDLLDLDLSASSQNV